VLGVIGEAVSNRATHKLDRAHGATAVRRHRGPDGLAPTSGVADFDCLVTRRRGDLNVSSLVPPLLEGEVLARSTTPPIDILPSAYMMCSLQKAMHPAHRVRAWSPAP
jgi:hypothetical protein